MVRVRPVLPRELNDDIAVTCSGDGTKVQVGADGVRAHNLACRRAAAGHAALVQLLI